jgi:hypothetical protein
MHNKLKEFEEPLLDNTLFKVQDYVLGDKKSQLEGIVANNSRGHRGINPGQHGVSSS